MRPTSSRVRESIFSILGQDLSGVRVLDLFAGAGTLGVEAVSRGAVSVTFVEEDRQHARAINENAELLKELAEVQVLTMDAARAIRLLARNADPFDLVFVDPPYGRGLALTTLEQLAEANAEVLEPDAMLVIETETDANLPPMAGSLVLDGKERIYGSTKLTFYREERSAA